MDYFDYGRESEFDIEEFLEQSQEQEQERLEQELERIDEQLERRDRIQDHAIEELESKLDWYIDRLETLYQRSVGKNGEREKLKNRIEQFYQEIRNENRSHWEDKQKLEKERRGLLRELDEIENQNLRKIF